MAVTSFAAIDAQCNQESNPGGLTRILIANHRNFTADWPTLADLDVANVLDTEPPLAATKTFVEFLVPDGTALQIGTSKVIVLLRATSTWLNLCWQVLRQVYAPNSRR